MKKTSLLILLLILIFSCSACKSENKNENQKITVRDNLIDENKFYKEGTLENNIYTNKSVNLSITIPEEYILFEKKEFEQLNSELTIYEVYGQTEDETASISIVSIQNSEKTSASMYIEGLKEKLKEQNQTNEEKSKYIILNSNSKILENKPIYTLNTKMLVEDEYYNQNYTCANRNEKIFCLISIFKDEKSDLNEKLNNNIKYIE